MRIRVKNYWQELINCARNNSAGELFNLCERLVIAHCVGKDRSDLSKLQDHPPELLQRLYKK
jgi:hypothetical protein